jgi:hypothetical protein
MDISPLTTIRCLILGHRFETHLVRCNGSHFIAASAGCTSGDLYHQMMAMLSVNSEKEPTNDHHDYRAYQARPCMFVSHAAPPILP